VSRARVGPVSWVSQCCGHVNLKVSIYLARLPTTCYSHLSIHLYNRSHRSAALARRFIMKVSTALSLALCPLAAIAFPELQTRDNHRFHPRPTPPRDRCLPQCLGIDLHTKERPALVPASGSTTSWLIWPSPPPRLPSLGHTRYVQPRTHSRKSCSRSRRRRTRLLRSDQRLCIQVLRCGRLQARHQDIDHDAIQHRRRCSWFCRPSQRPARFLYQDEDKAGYP
jgi:hypothetical protein